MVLHKDLLGLSLVTHVNDRTKLGMLGTIPKRVTGFHQYSSLFTQICSKQVAMASSIAHLTIRPGDARSIPSTRNI